MKLIKVTEKNKDKFTDYVQQKERPTLVLFYANWCPHCQMFEPTWKELSKKMGKNRKLQMAQVEYADMDYVPKKYKKIRGFPTIQMMKGGKVLSEFNDIRTMDALEVYIKRYI
uniref:Thioredoxin domain-containing protein n=1 Tax=viral metagenome TaxID=1070528 RepID=A0A6C0CUN7_9ZZZZ